MYKLKYIPDLGTAITLGSETQIAADLLDINGVSININSSSGSGRIGESVISSFISGKTFSISGVIYGKDLSSGKDMIRKSFRPFGSGKLYFNENYYIKVYVKSTPTFSPSRGDGRFSIQLYAPFPFFKKSVSNYYTLNIVNASFSYPVNFSTPHKFGETNLSSIIKIKNDGDSECNYKLTVYPNDQDYAAEFSNFKLENITTGQYLEINGDLKHGERLVISRDDDGYLSAVAESSSGTRDVINWISDSSNFFYINAGQSTIRFTAERTGGNSLFPPEVELEFREVRGSVYES